MTFADAWLDPTPRTLPTGEGFCCVRVAQHHALAALARLKQFQLSHQVGPVIAHHDRCYFLLRPDTDPAGWPSIATFCGRGTFVTVPPPQSRETDPLALRWLIAPRETGRRSFTDAHVLRPVLDDLDQQLTHRPSRPAPETATAAVTLHRVPRQAAT